MHILFQGFAKEKQASGEIGELLLEFGAPTNIKNYTNYSPLHQAVFLGQKEAVQWAIDYNRSVATTADGMQLKQTFNLNITGGLQGWTPLHIAVSENDLAILQLLLAANCDIWI